MNLTMPFRASGGRLAALAVAILAGVASGCDVAPSHTETGRVVPAYAAPTLAGEAVSLESLRGEVVLLNVWATWCYPCRKEMPSFEALHRELVDQGLKVVAVSIDRSGAAGEIESFLEEHGITFTILHDPDMNVGKTFRTIGVPETFLIDRHGRLVQRWIGRIDGHSPAVRGPILAALRER